MLSGTAVLGRRPQAASSASRTMLAYPPIATMVFASVAGFPHHIRQPLPHVRCVACAGRRRVLPTATLWPTGPRMSDIQPADTQLPPLTVDAQFVKDPP